MLVEHARAIAALGTDLRPDLFRASEQLYAPLHATRPPVGVTVSRDIVYGPGDRNRLDVFAPDGATARPVLIFIHGGGFVMGDKSAPGSPYYDNVGAWAARNGFVGVTMTYALVPGARYPSGAVDTAAAIGWAHAHIAHYGGDPDAIVVMGQSAGAIHAACYVARPDLWSAGRVGIAGVVLLSGVYEFAGEQPPNVLAYFGDLATAAAASPLPGLVAANVPLLFAVAELDPPVFHAQARQLTQALHARDGRFPAALFLPGHNHITEITHLNAVGIEDELLATHVAEFVGRVVRTRTTFATH